MGALIRTGASGKRVEMDGTNGLRAYDDGGNLWLQIPLAANNAGVLKTAGINNTHVTGTLGIEGNRSNDNNPIYLVTGASGHEASIAINPGTGVNSYVAFATLNTLRVGIDSNGLTVSSGDLIVDNYLQLMQAQLGSGTPQLGSNCPAVTLSAPVGWFKVKASDGSYVYIPAWK
jgi:hypothetical protein